MFNSIWNFITSCLTKINDVIGKISNHFFADQSQWLNLTLLVIILLFIAPILYLIDYIIKCIYHVCLFIFYFIKFIYRGIKKIFKPKSIIEQSINKELIATKQHEIKDTNQKALNDKELNPKSSIDEDQKPSQE